ncbi:MAG: PA2779 family protein [Bryobacteraceae bacterium]
MRLFPQRTLAAMTACTVLSLSVSPRHASAQEHVVALPELQRDARSAAEKRASNLADLNRVLQIPAAQDALRKAGINQEQVRRAIATLNDVELARLADRARAAEQDVEGGLIIGLLALIGLIVVIIVVASVVA